MTGKALIIDKRLCMALSIKPTGIQARQRFKTAQRDQIYYAIKFEKGDLVATNKSKSRTYRFAITNTNLQVII